MTMELPKAYEPQSVEDKWYAFWLQHHCFTADPGRVTGTSPWGATTIVDRRRDGAPDRIAALRTVTVNANLLSPHTLVPALDVTVGPGTHWLACAVGASDDADAVAPSKAPDVPDDLVARLEEFAAR